MSKYNVGDKFLVEIKEVLNSDKGTLYRSNFSTLTFDDYGLDNLEKVEELNPIHAEQVQECLMAQYNRGLNDAWELAKKILYGIDKQLIEIFDLKIEPVFFDLTHKRAIINDYTPQEALAKLEAYEKAQEEVKIGDVVIVDATHTNGIVIAIDKIEKKARLMYEDTSFRTNEWYLADLIKTGKHIDIESILSEIGKE